MSSRHPPDRDRIARAKDLTKILGTVATGGIALGTVIIKYGTDAISDAITVATFLAVLLLLALLLLENDDGGAEQ